MIIFFYAWQHRAKTISDRHEKLSLRIEEANSIVSDYYQLSLQQATPEDQAKKQALKVPSSIRYGTDGSLTAFHYTQVGVSGL